MINNESQTHCQKVIGIIHTGLIGIADSLLTILQATGVELSPLSWVPRRGKPGQYRAVHNFSFPHTPTHDVASINSTIDADLYPCTWGTFATVCFTIFNLPPGSQAAIRDVAEAYRTIPIVADQWPGLVVKLLNEDEFAINICDNFGLTSAGGIYGELGDATLDIFRAQGIGPSSKWVDDHIFFRIRRKSSFLLPCIPSPMPR